MATTAIGRDFDGEEPPISGCWCCGDRTVQASLLRLGEHPEVGVCFRCVRTLARSKRALERATRKGPSGTWWQRVAYRMGLGHC